MKKGFLMIFLVVISALFFVSSLNALPTQVVDLGDETIEMVQTGYSGDYRRENLAYWFTQNGITNKDGSIIDPVADQLQYELFYTDEARNYDVEFLGIGYAGYHSPFGVFTYGGNPFETFDSSYMTYYDPLFVQNEVSPGSTFNFQIEAGSYFGFYLNSNGKGVLGPDGSPVKKENKFLSTMVASNAMPNSNHVQNRDSYTLGLDHTLFFETNKGYTISFEDIVGGGDADYEDLVVNFSPSDDSGFKDPNNPVPEPGTFVLLGIGLVIMAVSVRRKKMRCDGNQTVSE